MRIQHNIAALNAHRQLTNNNNSVSKNLEKLSSGYKINRAGDDAAGLAISEKMRAQITGLETAQKNANDGISLVQTAEGALTEVHSMLNRMVELAEQSANGTYEDTVDRNNLQKELNSLRTEMDRIADGTNFNGINLLDGSLGGARVSSTPGVPASGGTPATAASFDVDLDVLLDSGIDADKAVSIGGIEVATGVGTGDKGSFKVNLSAVTIANSTNFELGDVTVPGSAETAKGAGESLAAIKEELGKTDGKVTIGGKEYAVTIDDSGVATFNAAESGDNSLTAAGIVSAIKNNNSSLAESTVSAIVDGTADVALDKEAALAAVKAGIADQEFTFDGKKYTATMNGSKLTFTAKEVGVNEPIAATIADAISNGTTKLAEGKVDNIKNGAAATPPTIPATNAKTEMEFGTKPKVGDTIKIGDTTYEFVASAADAVSGTGNTAIAIGSDSAATASNFKTAIESNTAIKDMSVTGSKVTFYTADGATDVTKPVTIEQQAKGLTLQIGDTADDFNKLSVSVNSMKADALGIGSIDIGTQDGASDAIKKIKDAINTVSSTRGDLGAIQNRLEHTINNLSVTSENMTAAESRIRDVDMAQEMMEFTKNNILTQASQSMLAQANQLPQGVLQLLQ